MSVSEDDAMGKEAYTICCKVDCPQRMECGQFQRALDVNAGKEKVYEIVECVNYSRYEK